MKIVFKQEYGWLVGTLGAKIVPQRRDCIFTTELPVKTFGWDFRGRASGEECSCYFRLGLLVWTVVSTVFFCCGLSCGPKLWFRVLKNYFFLEKVEGRYLFILFATSYKSEDRIHAGIRVVGGNFWGIDCAPSDNI